MPKQLRHLLCGRTKPEPWGSVWDAPVGMDCLMGTLCPLNHVLMQLRTLLLCLLSLFSIICSFPHLFSMCLNDSSPFWSPLRLVWCLPSWLSHSPKRGVCYECHCGAIQVWVELEKRGEAWAGRLLSCTLYSWAVPAASCVRGHKGNREKVELLLRNCLTSFTIYVLCVWCGSCNFSHPRWYYPLLCLHELNHCPSCRRALY